MSEEWMVGVLVLEGGGVGNFWIFVDRLDVLK
jgi:hypothetical protein